MKEKKEKKMKDFIKLCPNILGNNERVLITEAVRGCLSQKTV